MSDRKESNATLARISHDPFGMLREMTSDFERMFSDPSWLSFRRPWRGFAGTRGLSWSPEVDVFERNNRLITKIDLPGMKKEDVKVEVADGHLAISGERKSETEEEKGNVYRSEREYGSFYRAVPLPEGVKLEDVKASFSDGVLEVSVPLPAKAKATVRKVEIEETKAAKTAA